MLELQNVGRWFGGLPALQEVTFNVPPAKVTALIGPNGAGKSTLINCISGVDTCRPGTILLEGKRIEKLPAHRIAELGVARTFQNIELFPQMTVIDNLLTNAAKYTERGSILVELDGRYLRRRFLLPERRSE